MANPLTPDQLVQALKLEGVKVREYPGWRTHNRNHKGPWGPVHGAMLHHTVTGITVDGVKICHDGYSGLPGPLCQIVIRRNGEVWLIGNGRANHAGGGDPNVLQAVKDERYTTRPPTPQRGNSNGIDGNAHFYGMECENLGNGKDPWPAAQVEAMVRTSAAICRSHVWTAKSVIEHQEWSSDKTDPRGPGYPGGPAMRSRIQERLNHPPSWSPTAPAPKPTPAPGGTVTVPNFLHLVRTEDVNLIPDSPHTIYWTGEITDEGNAHGAGNKTVAYADTDYNAVVHLAFEGLADGDYVTVYPVLEGGTETPLAAVDFYGHTNGPVATWNASWNGNVPDGKQLVFRVVNRSAHDVQLVHARLSMLTWPT